MDKDITPGLIENVNKAFEINCMKDGNMQAMTRKLEEGAASYSDAYQYAVSVGNARAKAFKSEINSDILPDGRMYYNIADRLMNDSLGTDHDLVADYAAKVQELCNQRDGIGLKAQIADKDESRIKGFIDRLDSEDNFDDVAWILDEPVKVHAMSVVDDTIKKNAEFHGKAGIKATVTRDAKSDCCGWCTDLAGDYVYPRVPNEVFARHDNCRCTLDYAGRRLSAYETGGKAHSFRDQGEQEKIEKRKEYAEKASHRVYNKFGDFSTEEYASAIEMWRKLEEYPDLSPKEKEWVYEMFDNNLTNEEKTSALVCRPFGDYRYYAVNKGHNQYKIYNKEPIEPTAGVVDEVLTEMFGSDWRNYL